MIFKFLIVQLLKITLIKVKWNHSSDFFGLNHIIISKEWLIFLIHSTLFYRKYIYNTDKKFSHYFLWNMFFNLSLNNIAIFVSFHWFCVAGSTMIRLFFIICFLSNTCVSREVNPGNCENTILENLSGAINTSSSDLTKEVLTTFLLRVNGESRFNATKERKCKDHSQTYQQV